MRSESASYAACRGESASGMHASSEERYDITAVTSPCVRPFFSYYGGKWRDTPVNYDPPNYETIIEPFAGSAGYSLRHPHRKVILCEIDPIVFGVWDYLINVSEREIRGIPDVPLNGSVDDLGICQEARWLVGFWLNRATTGPRKTPSRWMREKIRPGSFWGNRVRETIASQLRFIRDWEVHNCSYENCPVWRKSTWFIDPPYESAGQHYRFGSNDIDYKHLAEWCRGRRGQVIVCENKGAKWLPFKPVAEVKTTRSGRRSKEVVWVKDD